MGLLSGLMSHASEISIEKLQKEFSPILIEGEILEKSYKVIRDMYVFANKWLIFVDKQVLTGSKIEYQSIPYRTIIHFSKESSGLLDLDAELKIWLSGMQEPIKKEFKKDSSINEVYQLLSKYILK